MISFDDRQISGYLQQIYDEEQETRINAINQLGEIGDELCLKELREILKLNSREHQALIIAVGKLKRKLNLK
jgi:HEAT repeat protein